MPYTRPPVLFRYARRHLGFLAALLLAAVALGIAYRYLFDPLEQRTLPFFTRSCLHAVGVALSGWAAHVALAAAPRSRLGDALRITQRWLWCDSTTPLGRLDLDV